MKSRVLDIKVTMIAALLSFNVFAFGQENNGDELYRSIYFYNVGDLSAQRTYKPTQKDIERIVLYEFPDEMTIRKKPSVEKEEIESIVKSYLPDAQFGWELYESDICSVITGMDGLNDAIRGLLEDERILSACHKYTRKTYMDLKEFFPVSRLATYGITNVIRLTYLNNEIVNEANEYIASKGLEIIPDQYNPNRATVEVSKTYDIIALANEIYESGFFLIACPSLIPGEKNYSAQPIDKTELPYYDYYSSGKKYLYELPDRFMVQKRSETDMTTMESIIRTSLEECDITWFKDDFCTVITYPELLETAMEALFQKDEVLRVTHKYMEVSVYERMMLEGLGYPSEFGLDGRISISFKDEVTDSIKNQIIKNYDLSLVYDDTIFGAYSIFMIPNESDVLFICNSIHDTGLVRSVTPGYIGGDQNGDGLRFLGPTSNVKTTPVQAQETGVQYYDLLGRRIDAPSGLTIEVKRYSDGTVRTQKILFK